MKNITNTNTKMFNDREARHMTFFESDMTECPVELSLRVINRKWFLQIIRDMFFGKKKIFRI